MNRRFLFFCFFTTRKTYLNKRQRKKKARCVQLQAANVLVEHIYDYLNRMRHIDILEKGILRRSKKEELKMLYNNQFKD